MWTVFRKIGRSWRAALEKVSDACLGCGACAFFVQPATVSIFRMRWKVLKDAVPGLGFRMFKEYTLHTSDIIPPHTPSGPDRLITNTLFCENLNNCLCGLSLYK